MEWIGATKVLVDPGAPIDEARAVFEAAAVDAVLTDAAHQALPGAHLPTPTNPSPPPAPPAPAPWRSSGSPPTAPPSSIPA